jgi:hypothetical protein
MDIEFDTYVTDADNIARGLYKSVQHRRKLQKHHGFPEGFLVGRARRFSNRQIKGWVETRPTGPVPPTYTGKRR